MTADGVGPATEPSDAWLAERFLALWDGLAAIGHLPSGATERLPWTAEDRAARDWFADTATARGLTVETDRNGNLWAWWPGPGDAAIATGSHLDTVPGGGAWDGALGVVSGFLAIDLLRATGVAPTRPIVVVAWTEEEGARFGVATLGSRLATGVVDAASMRGRVDAAGVTFASAVAALGIDPDAMGSDPGRLARLHAFVELHVEQGRVLQPLGRALATGTGIDPHGRWRVVLEGSGDHAGTARLEDRHDPMLVLAALIKAARRAAARHGGVATVGRVIVQPNGSNVVPGQVLAWLDARALEEDTVRAIVATTRRSVERAGRSEGVRVTITEESWTPAIRFDPGLRARIEAILHDAGMPSVAVSTAAGHDAGVLDAHLPTAMLFVRNPTGISHAPAEGASIEDALIGVRALAAVLADLAAGP